MDKIDYLEITGDKDVAVAAFKAASMCDPKAIESMSHRISKFIEENHPSKVVVDFKGVKFFSSQVLGVLLKMRSKMQIYDGEIVISAINPQMYRVFRITNLNRIFRFFPDRQSAIAAVNTN